MLKQRTLRNPIKAVGIGLHTGKNITMVHPAYDQCIKASHIFNILDARSVISVTERQAYIGRVRGLAKQCADAFILTPAGGKVK